MSDDRQVYSSDIWKQWGDIRHTGDISLNWVYIYNIYGPGSEKSALNNMKNFVGKMRFGKGKK